MTDKYSKRRLKSSSLITIVSLSLVLFLLGLVGLILLNTKKLSDHVKENISIQVIIKDNEKSGEIEKLKKTFSTSPFVRLVQFIDKEEAAAILKEDLGEDFITFLGYNPLLSSFNIYLKADYANIDSLQWIEKGIMANRNVKEVIYQKSLISIVNENVRKISIVILAFSSVLMIIALALINNTIRLSIYSKRFLIKTMQLVGATRRFIRRPFVLKGIKHGIYSAIVAIVLLIGVIVLAQKQIPELMVLQDKQLMGTLFGIVLFLGILISWISTSMAVRKYLRLRTDELYF